MHDGELQRPLLGLKLVMRDRNTLVDISSKGQGEISRCFMQRGMVGGLCSKLLRTVLTNYTEVLLRNL